MSMTISEKREQAEAKRKLIVSVASQIYSNAIQTQFQAKCSRELAITSAFSVEVETDCEFSIVMNFDVPMTLSLEAAKHFADEIEKYGLLTITKKPYSME